MRKPKPTIINWIVAVALTLTASSVLASSHMDAPLITLDPSANTTDVYAFKDEMNGNTNLVVALGVYPFEEPGIGPNKYNFDDNVLYEIHVSLGADVAAGRPTLDYQFEFKTTYANPNTILVSYLCPVVDVGDDCQNLVQHYTVTKVDHRVKGKKGAATVLGTGIVPPNNQGIATPAYNQGNDGNNPAKDGVATAGELDHYTASSIASLTHGYVAFAGQRDDGFYADVQSVFDLLSLRNPGKDSQAGFNIHLMALAIPLGELGTNKTVGVYASTSRRGIQILRQETDKGNHPPKVGGNWIQVARQGNPLFNEVLVAVKDKDLYSRTTPDVDATLFKKYALTPEPAALINALLLGSGHPEITTGRTDIAGIFIPDLIKVDITTPVVRQAGNGTNNVSANDADAGWSRLSVFGGDVLTNATGEVVAGGWPNGRRFGDDVVDIAVNALLGPSGVFLPSVDNVNFNDKAYNKVFPYESTPHNGRNHEHP